MRHSLIFGRFYTICFAFSVVVRFESSLHHGSIKPAKATLSERQLPKMTQLCLSVEELLPNQPKNTCLGSPGSGTGLRSCCRRWSIPTLAWSHPDFRRRRRWDCSSTSSGCQPSMLDSGRGARLELAGTASYKIFEEKMNFCLGLKIGSNDQSNSKSNSSTV